MYSWTPVDMLARYDCCHVISSQKQAAARPLSIRRSANLEHPVRQGPLSKETSHFPDTRRPMADAHAVRLLSALRTGNTSSCPCPCPQNVSFHVAIVGSFLPCKHWGPWSRWPEDATGPQFRHYALSVAQKDMQVPPGWAVPLRSLQFV